MPTRAEQRQTVLNRTAQGATLLNMPPIGDARNLPLDRIDPNPHQTRQAFDEAFIENLAEHLREGGMLLQPIRVRPSGARYEIVNGEQRYRAALAAGWTHIPAISEEMSDEAADFATFEENARRTNPHPEDIARHLAHLSSSYKLSERELAKRTGMPRGTISMYLRVFHQRPDLLSRIGLPEKHPDRLTWQDALSILTAPEVADDQPPRLADSTEAEEPPHLTERAVLEPPAAPRTAPHPPDLNGLSGDDPAPAIITLPWRRRPLDEFGTWLARTPPAAVPPKERPQVRRQLAEIRAWTERFEQQLRDEDDAAGEA